MKLRLSSRNSAKAALSSLICLSLVFGCSLPFEPTYTLENLNPSLVKIADEEYHIHIMSTLAGRTLWIYLPVQEDIFIEADPNKSEEDTKRFEVNSIEGYLKDGTMGFQYDAQELPEDIKERQKTTFNPNVSDKINKVLRSVRRVLFSLKRHKDEPQFFVMAVADTKKGIEMITITFVDDFKKAFYEIISWTEYQHRAVQNIGLSFEAIGDLEGKHLKLQDMDFRSFLIEQMKQRIRIKFNHPEVEKGTDVDREVIKSIKKVLEIYKFEDFSFLELKNLFTSKNTSLSRAAVLEKAKE